MIALYNGCHRNEVEILTLPIKKDIFSIALQLEDTVMINSLRENPALLPPDFLETRDRAGYTPLMLAARNDDLDSLHFLLTKGAEVDSMRNREDTPFSLAINRGSYSAAEALLKAKAKPFLGYIYLVVDRVWVNNTRMRLIKDRIEESYLTFEARCLLDEGERLGREIDQLLLNSSIEPNDINWGGHFVPPGLEGKMLEWDQQLKKLEEQYPYFPLSSSSLEGFVGGIFQAKRTRETAEGDEHAPSAKRNRQEPENEPENTKSGSFQFF